jgi:hypothetical protein
MRRHLQLVWQPCCETSGTVLLTIVLLVDAELHFSSRVCVSKTQDGAVDVAGLKLLDQLAAVLAEPTEEIRDHL